MVKIRGNCIMESRKSKAKDEKKTREHTKEA